ncbi:16S rRNA (guanine(966)-N(2))-methyltransferase RsmD [Luteimonas sp. e5]
MKRTQRRKATLARAGAVRIIGGRWRGSRLPVADIDGLRPTPDRLRETLFNWLQPVLPGARVLDLFAGSGALGLEALSRGARAATLIERDAGLVQALRSSATRLGAGDAARIVHVDALAWLADAAGERVRYDIAFIDPPFAADVWADALAGTLPLMADAAWLYLEAPAGAVPPVLPADWQLHREAGSRETTGRLFRRQPPAGAARDGVADC